MAIRSTKCYVDGSWADNGYAGVGVVLVQGEDVVCWKSKMVEAMNPFQAEARAVLEGYRLMRQKGYHHGMV